jgi:hypothetical protein
MDGEAEREAARDVSDAQMSGTSAYQQPPLHAVGEHEECAQAAPAAEEGSPAAELQFVSSEALHAASEHEECAQAAPAAEEGSPAAELPFVSSTRPRSLWASLRAASPMRLRRAGSAREPLQHTLDADVVAATALAHAAEAVCSEHPTRAERARLRSERRRDEDMQRALSEWQRSVLPRFGELRTSRKLRELVRR